MTEELGLDQLRGNGGTVHLHKGTGLAATLGMDVSGHHFFSGSVCPRDHHPSVGRSHFGNDAPDLLQCRTLADHVMAIAVALPLTQDHRFLPQLFAVRRISQGHEHPVQIEGFLDEVVRTGLQRLYGEFHTAVACHDDDRGGHAFQGQRLHHLDAVLPGHLHIAENHIEPPLQCRFQAGISIFCIHHLVLLVFENVAQGVANETFVVDDEDAGHVTKIEVVGQMSPLCPSVHGCQAGSKPALKSRTASTKRPSATVCRDLRTSSNPGKRSKRRTIKAQAMAM